MHIVQQLNVLLMCETKLAPKFDHDIDSHKDAGEGEEKEDDGQNVD